MDGRRMMAIEAFSLCGMSCSFIDRELGMVPGYTHRVVTEWWYDNKLGRGSDAVRRWVRDLKAFAASRSDLAYIDRRGMGSSWAWAMAQGALRYVPDEAARDIRIERVGDRVIARKVGRDGR